MLAACGICDRVVIVQHYYNSFDSIVNKDQLGILSLELEHKIVNS